MTELDQESFREAAGLCVDLVESDFSQLLDGSLDSPTALDHVCAALIRNGALEGERLDLWTNLAAPTRGKC